jgi:hypothetical protein
MKDFNEFMGYELNLHVEDIMIEESIEESKKEIESLLPFELKALKKFDEEVLSETETKKTIKNFYLSKRNCKKTGYVYTVRYRDDNGVIIPSHWSTGTSIYGKALDFATNNRGKILQDYYAKNEADDLYKILSGYYDKNGSEAYNLDVKRGDRKPLRRKKQETVFCVC